MDVEKENAVAFQNSFSKKLKKKFKKKNEKIVLLNK